MSPKNNKSKTISIRLSESMLEALDNRVDSEDKDRTQIIRDAISAYLDLPPESVKEAILALDRRVTLIEESLNKS